MRPWIIAIACLVCLGAGYRAGATAASRESELRLRIHLKANWTNLPDLNLIELTTARVIRHGVTQVSSMRDSWRHAYAEEAVRATKPGNWDTLGPNVVSELAPAQGLYCLMRSIENKSLCLTSWDPRLIGL